jgi:hypothetical protein
MAKKELVKYSICKRVLAVTVMIIAFFSILRTSSFGALLVWDANNETDLAGYQLYYGTSSRNYEFVVDMGSVTAYNLKNLNLRESFNYYIALTSYDYSGNESDFSEEIDYFADDNIPDGVDNCPEVYNPKQEDTYPPENNGIGNICECEGDFFCDGDVDGLDCMFFEVDFGRNQFHNPCSLNNPCNGDFDCDGDVDGWDGVLFKADFGRSEFNNPCPDCEVGEWCSYPLP